MTNKYIKGELSDELAKDYTIERLFACISPVDNNISPTYRVDAEMIPILTELNEKGWITEYACQGHYTPVNERVITYITFKHDYKFPTEAPLYNLDKNARRKVGSFTKIDVRSVYARDKGNPRYCSRTYYWFGSKSKKINKEAQRQDLIKKLFEWSKNLPINKEEQRYE